MKHCLFITSILLLFLAYGLTTESPAKNNSTLRNFNRSRYSLRRLGSTTIKPNITLNDTSTELIVDETTLSPNKTKVTTTTAVPRTTKKPSNVTTTTIKTPATETVITTTTEKPSLKCGIAPIDETYPWIAVIEHIDPTKQNSRVSLSKGVLIDDRHVITTVSSIHNALPFWTISRVRLGDSPVWSIENGEKHNRSEMEIADVEEVYQHQYKDIAIIKLNRKIKFSNIIHPICLPTDDNYNFRELFLHVCKRFKTKLLQKVMRVKTISVIPLSPQDCTTMFHRKKAIFTLEEFCAWDEYGDTCTGDVGGPLMGSVNGKWHLIGLNSYANAKVPFKADDYPGVYTRVGSHLKWIESVLELSKDNDS